MRYLYLAALAASALATPALAQDNTATTGKFDGFHIEALGGVDYTGATAVVRDQSSTNPVVATGVHETGALFGANVGFDFQAGTNFVAGVEGEVTRATTEYCTRQDITTSTVTNATVGSPLIIGTACRRTGRDIYGGARLGFVVSPNAMLYVKGGYTRARGIVNYNYVSGFVGRNFITSDQPIQRSLDGFRVGAGIEFNPMSMLLVKLEYRYSKYQQHFDRHQLLMGLGVRF